MFYYGVFVQVTYYVSENATCYTYRCSLHAEYH